MGADQDRSLPSTPTGQVVSSGARSEEGKDAAGDVCIAHEPAMTQQSDAYRAV